MSIVNLLLQKIASLFLVMLFGFILAKAKIVQASDSKSLSRVTVYILTPCSILNAFQVSMTKEIQQGLILAFLAALLAQAILLLLTTLFGKVLKLNSVEKASVLYSNALNMIIPLVTSALGEVWVIFASAYMMIQLVMMWSYGKNMLCGEKGFDVKKVLGNINMIAVFCGILILISGFRFTGILASTVSGLGGMVGNMAMLIAGILVGTVDLKKAILNRRLWITCVLRLVVCPLIMVFLLKALASVVTIPNAKTILMITLMATITPSASTVTQMAQLYTEHGGYASSINAVTTALCVITIPFMIFLYQL